MKCNNCPRKCNIERDNIRTGFCLAPASIKIARYSLHMWEEPCISGANGSGTIFFSGCNLGCIYCQNNDIAHKNTGKIISPEKLVEIMLTLQERGAHNINLVTPSHYIHQLVSALKSAKENGLHIPVIYNSSAYDSVESLKKLDGLIDIYLPDYKYADSAIAGNFSNAPDYPTVAAAAISEMYRQTGPCRFFEDNGIIKSGVIVRHLVLPLHTRNSTEAIKYLYDTYKDNIFISIMSQYTPPEKKLKYEELNRRITAREYDKVVDYAIELGISNAFIQDMCSAVSKYIPEFSDAPDAL